MAPDASRLLLCLFLFFLISTTISSLGTATADSAATPEKPPASDAPISMTSNTTLPPTKPPSTTTNDTIPPPSAPISTSGGSTLDPKQLRALQSLNIPTSKDPCSPLHNATTTCDGSKPFRHLLSLTLANCSDDVALSLTALKSLYTLTSLTFVDCPVTPIRFPSELTANLHSFTVINSLKKLTGVFLSHLQNLTQLTVSGVTINASGPFIILNSMKDLQSVSLSFTNLTGPLPKHWHPNLTHIDLSGNELKGRIPVSLTQLENLVYLNLSSNSLNETIPHTFGDLTMLQNVSLASNSLSGEIPESFAAMPELVHLDLGNNQLNGTIPNFLADMKGLKYLNLEKNSFHGVLPFNASFIKRMEVFRVGGNDGLCYNHTKFSGKVKLGISPCDKHGLPMSPPPAKDTSGDSEESSADDDYNADDEDDDQKQEHHSHGPSKVVLGVAIGLSAIVFLIVFLVLLSKWCG